MIPKVGVLATRLVVTIPPSREGTIPVRHAEAAPERRDLPRAPYQATLVELIERFGSSERRNTILRGLLKVREILEASHVSGFQWISGSFVEDGLDREPGDVDVVTFYFAAGLVESAALVELTDAATSKKKFDVDHYFCSLDEAPDLLVDDAVYWYELWSARRGGGRKGFLRVDLGEPLAEALKKLEERGS